MEPVEAGFVLPEEPFQIRFIESPHTHVIDQIQTWGRMLRMEEAYEADEDENGLA